MTEKTNNEIQDLVFNERVKQRAAMDIVEGDRIFKLSTKQWVEVKGVGCSTWRAFGWIYADGASYKYEALRLMFANIDGRFFVKEEKI